MKIDVSLKEDAQLPKYTREGDAGLDLCATKEMTLAPFERALVPTGVQMAITKGYGGLVLPRSGLSIQHGITVVNSPGLIDSNFRGEVQVIAINLDPQKSYTIHKGDRIAQLVIVKVEEVSFQICEQLDTTERGGEGFGSSGI